jgi:hypothetical protein
MSNKRTLNPTCKRYKEQAIKGFKTTAILLVAIGVGYWAYYTQNDASTMKFLLRCVIFGLEIPTVCFFVNGLGGLLGYMDYTEFYSPYEEELPHGRGKKKLTKRQRQKQKLKEQGT